MPESRASAEQRAEKEGFPKGNIVCLNGNNDCYIVPHHKGTATDSQKRQYAHCRHNGGEAGICAGVFHKALKGESMSLIESIEATNGSLSKNEQSTKFEAELDIFKTAIQRFSKFLRNEDGYGMSGAKSVILQAVKDIMG
jgi:hypothetical protein